MKSMQTIDAGDMQISFVSLLASDTEKQISLCHEKYEIFYITSGGGKCVCEGVEHNLSARSLFISRPFEYRIINFDKSSPYSYYSVVFTDTSLSESIREMLYGIFEGDGGVCYQPGVQHTSLDSCFDRFYVAAGLPERERTAYTEALLSELIILLSATDSDRSTHTGDNLSTRVSKYINANLNRDLSLDSLARRFFVNKYYLCRTFKEQSGTSIHSYINQKRTLYAKQLIESGETASRAAYRVGFGDYSAFYRAYTKLYGSSPTGAQNKGGKL